MLISASVRPRGLKKGRNMEKKLAAILGVEPSLRQMVGLLELSADTPMDFAFLTALYAVIRGIEWGGGGKIEITALDGKRCVWEEKPPAEEHATVEHARPN